MFSMIFKKLPKYRPDLSRPATCSYVLMIILTYKRDNIYRYIYTYYIYIYIYIYMSIERIIDIIYETFVLPYRPYPM